MYKIICDNQVIDVVKNLTFYIYLPKSKSFKRCKDPQVACGLRGSNKSVMYYLEGSNFPQDNNHEVVSYEQIDSIEFMKLTQRLKDKVPCFNNTLLTATQMSKIEELSKACNNAIIDGITVKVEDKVYDFELTTEDQLNLRMIETMLMSGRTSFIYHAKNKPAEIFTADQMKQIIYYANKHILYHTTYFTLLKNCIYKMDNIAEILELKYGCDLPDVQSRKLLTLI